MGGGGAGVYGALERGGRLFRPPGGRGGGRYDGRYPTAGVVGPPDGLFGCADKGRDPPIGELGRDGAGPIGLAPGRGRCAVVCAVGLFARTAGGGTEVTLGVSGVSEGGCFSTRSLMVGGTTRPVGFTDFGLVAIGDSTIGVGFSLASEIGSATASVVCTAAFEG